MNYISDIPFEVADSAIHGVDRASSRLFNAVVEISNGDNVKYEVHPSGKYLTAVRALNPIFNYPFSYGFIPETLAEDGDGIDVIIITPEPLARLSVIEIRVLGYVPTTDNGKRDDKIIAVPAYSSLKRVSMDKVTAFLKNYKYPNNADSVIGEFVQNVAQAEARIDESHARWVNSLPVEPTRVEGVATPAVAHDMPETMLFSTDAACVSTQHIKPQETPEMPVKQEAIVEAPVTAVVSETSCVQEPEQDLVKEEIVDNGWLT